MEHILKLTKHHVMYGKLKRVLAENVTIILLNGNMKLCKLTSLDKTVRLANNVLHFIKTPGDESVAQMNRSFQFQDGL